MQEIVWWWESFHYVSHKNRKAVQHIQMGVRRDSDKALTDDSEAVLSSNGFYIYQEKGITHIIGNKMVRVESRYFVILLSYLKIMNGEITLEAKQIFETGNIDAIKVLLGQKALKMKHFWDKI